MAGAQDDLDDLMGGFDDDFDTSSIDTLEDEPPAWLSALPYGDWIYENVDLSGSISTGAVYNLLDHSVVRGSQPNRRTPYGGLSRLDIDGFLQLDIELPHDFQLRAEMLGWYDFAYRIRGRGSYDGGVLDVYEWQFDSGEVYLTGPLTDIIDITIGRKIVNWGRSDTFRVVDAVNPLDRKEPGLVDIEDLRRPTTMVKLDLATGAWNATFLVIPEHRYDRLPPPGNDFNANGIGLGVAIDDTTDFSGTPGFAARFGAVFSGWDFSVYGSYLDESARVSDRRGTNLRSESNRFGLVGAGGNYTIGSWLFKMESAYLFDLQVPRFVPTPPFFFSSEEYDRVDTMVGIEYYGPDSLTIALEVVNRHFLEYSRGSSANSGNPGQPIAQSNFETGLRITRPFFRERLDLTALAIVLGERFQDGALLRFQADFELADAWLLSGGGLFFWGDSDRGLGAYSSNNRLFAELKYSF